jgi:hypothetical protein
MSAYENRRVMVDPGLTARAFRSLHERDGQYPFVEQAVRHRRPGGRNGRADDAGWLRPFLAFLTHGRGAARWCGRVDAGPHRWPTRHRDSLGVHGVYHRTYADAAG